MINTGIKFAFFGSSKMSISVLDQLEKSGLKPAIVVTTPDKPVGRKLAITPNVVKQWAKERDIAVFDPAKLDQSFIESFKTVSEKIKIDVSIVASYGKIIPIAVIDIPKQKTLNIHPSLLPKYRGPSPLQTAILDDTKKTGVTIMAIDEAMDHGPIIAQKAIDISKWPTYKDFEDMMAREGAKLLVDILPKWVANEIVPREQDHSVATYTKKVIKEDALLDLKSGAYDNFRKIQAYHEWPQAYFLVKKANKTVRVKVTAASYENDVLTIERVIPEGGREMSFRDFKSGYGDPMATSL